MTHNIIKTDNYLLIVSDEEIKVNDWFYLNDANIIAEYISVKPVNEAKKIIAHLPLNNSPVLEFVPLLPPLEDGVEEIVKDYVQELIDCKSVKEHERTWISAICHQLIIKAQEKYKYTEEDLTRAFNIGINSQFESTELKLNKDESFDRHSKNLLKLIQSLQQPKMPAKRPVAFECEIFEVKDLKSVDEDWLKLGQPKTTTNPQGQTVLVGKYIY